MLLRGALRRHARGPDRRQPAEPPRTRGRRQGGARRGARATGRRRRSRPRSRGTTRPTGSASTPAPTRSSPSWCASCRTARPAIQIEPDFSRDATQACFAMADHPGIFARLAGALALAGANVVDARTYTSTDGIATAAFWIQDAEGKPYEKARLTRLRSAVTRTLRGEIVAARRAEGQGPHPQARARLRRADPHRLRQQRLRHLHDRRGRDPRPPRPALRPRADPDRQQRLDRLGDHRDLRQAGGRRLLRQGPVRPEAARREQAPHARDPAARGDRRGARVEPSDPAAARLPRGRLLDDGRAACSASPATS